MDPDPISAFNNQPLLTDTENSMEKDDILFNIPYPADQSLFGGVQILLNTAMGSGTLMIPYCYICGIGNALII